MLDMLLMGVSHIEINERRTLIMTAEQFDAILEQLNASLANIIEMIQAFFTWLGSLPGALLELVFPKTEE